MSYTINPNAKNRWARNAENTMDLSLETDASSVYLDNGRTLEQEIGEGSMSSNVTTVDSAMNKVIDGTLDGAYESLAFKGKSLVNLVRLNSKMTSSSPIDINILPIDHTKTYLLKVRVNEAPTFTNESDGQMALKVQYFSTNDAKGFTAISNSNMVKGYELTKIVTPTLESNTNGRFSLWTPRYISGTLDVDVVFTPYQEGMENWDIPYFEGLCDAKMPILRNVGKNLINEQNNTDGRFVWTTGEEYSDSNTIRTDFVRVPSNTTVYSDYKAHFFLYDRDKQYLGVNKVGNKTSSAGSMKNTLTIDSSVTYVRIYWDKTSGENNQLTVSSTATPYENYKTNILRTSEEVVLREVNGVQDTYNPLTGEYVKRIGEVVITSAVAKSVVVLDKNVRVNIAMSALNGDNGTTKANNTLSDKFYWSEANARDIEGLRVNGNTLYWCISRDRLTSQDLQGVNTWLQSNPITVQYILAKPITTIVEPSTTPFAYENGHIILESGHEGQSLLPTLEYSTVVNKTGLVENVAKTIQRQEKQITKLEQMLIKNIINLDYNNTFLTLKNEMEEML